MSESYAMEHDKEFGRMEAAAAAQGEVDKLDNSAKMASSNDLDNRDKDMVTTPAKGLLYFWGLLMHPHV